MALPPIHVQIPDGKLSEILDPGELAKSAVCGTSNSPGFPGVWGVQNSGGQGVVGNGGDTGEGVYGEGGNGVHGKSKIPKQSGVWGENVGGGYGVSGSTNSDSTIGVIGTSGVVGTNGGTGYGTIGLSTKGDGILGHGAKNGVRGDTNSDSDSGVWGTNTGKGFGVTGSSPNGTGVLGQGGNLAGRFEGDVEITGDIRLINQDCAEDFDILCAEEIGPGTVMVITTDGALQVSRCAYDNRVAGVISGIGTLKPGIILGRQESRGKRLPIALLGKVYCKVDASCGPIEVGDLLTSSHAPGHAMKSGRGLIPILIALQ